MLTIKMSEKMSTNQLASARPVMWYDSELPVWNASVVANQLVAVEICCTLFKSSNCTFAVVYWTWFSVERGSFVFCLKCVPHDN